MLLALACASCERESRAGDSASPEDALRQRTDTRFARADFLKPRMDGSAPIDPYLAPLIYLETPHDAPLGTVMVNAEGERVADPNQPVVYYADRLVQLEGRERRQLTYIWFRSVQLPRAQGVRLTFDADGFPVITEVLADDGGVHTVYVTHGMEESAAETLGGPLPGRAFAIEDAPSREYQIVLVGTIGSAPAPSGPYLYQARDANDIVTIHCRCSPTQADEIDEMIEYELIPLEAIEGVWPLEGESDFAAPASLARSLRLPASF